MVDDRDDGPSGDGVLNRADLDRLFEELRRDGFETYGPTVRDGAIVHGVLRSSADLPIGWTDHQGPGTYRVEERFDAACFGYAVGPHTFKAQLFAPEATLWEARHDGSGLLEIQEPDTPPPRRALIGVRPCDAAAIAIQDRIFLGREARDADYARRRANAFLVVVDCNNPEGTCFCDSMGTGPHARDPIGADLVLTELLEGTAHLFLARAGSAAGAALLARLPTRPATENDRAIAERLRRQAVERMGRRLDVDGLPQGLAAAAEHPRWNRVAERCLACANCTLVCPTCFCHEVEDVVDLSGRRAQRRRTWSSCFTSAHSYIHGGSIRASTAARYRQWLTHKLSGWHRQFGMSGCVGCGRCITWCPVGIDLTEEVRALRAEPTREVFR